MVTINSSGDTQRRAPPPGLLRLRHRKCFPKSSSGGRSDNRGQGVSVTGCTFGLRPAVKASPFGVDLLLNQVLRCAARADWPRPMSKRKGGEIGRASCRERGEGAGGEGA